MNATKTILAATTALTLAAGTVAWAPSDDLNFGSCTITVLHPITRLPVPNIPVTLLAVIKPEAAAPIYWTGRNGSVMVTNLREGFYDTFVSYNNQVSETVRFEVIGEKHPMITLYFNPDIDVN
jgi:hypothetical protein